MVVGERGALNIARVDWSAPWFEPVAATARDVDCSIDLRQSLNAAAERRGIVNARGRAVRFGAADAAGAAAYEEHIGSTGEVPTRDNAHDVFNALVWLTFPRAKARLNALQAQAIAAAGVQSTRGPLRDAATLVDENAIFLVTRRADLVDALAAHRWHALFVEHRAAWRQDIRPVVFGHALMEKLTAPYKGITAHALVVPLDPDASLAAIDESAARLLDAALTPSCLLPLPVLGIPGWADNADPRFYDDARVFRPPRTPRTTDLCFTGAER